MKSASFSRPVEDLEGKINSLLEALSTTQMITNHFKYNREVTDMERDSISHHVEDLKDKINQLLVPLSTTQMITNHFILNREITDMERASISHHVEDLEGKINQLLVPLSTTQMITNHFILNQEITDMERASISRHVEDLEGKIKQLLGSLSRAKGIIKAYKLDLEKPAEDLGVELKKRTEERRKKSDVNIRRYRPLIRAIQENDVKAWKAFLDKNPDAMKSEIDEFGHTIFHLLVGQRYFNSETVKPLKELVSNEDSPETLEILNVNNMTALDIAASAGNTEAVKVFVKKYRHLLSTEKEEEAMERLPVHHAASWGREETVRYLLSVTDWTKDNYLDSRASLLMTLIQSNLHDIPLKDDQDHIAWPNVDSEDGDVEKQNPKCSTNCSEEFPTHPQIASIIVPSIKRIHAQKLMHTQTLEIVKLMISKVNWTYKEASERLKEPVLTAARLGIHEFVEEVLKAYQYSVFFNNEEGRNTFFLAVSYRKEKVFSLIYDQMAAMRDYTTYVRDSNSCNILHAAAKFMPSSQVSGSALQMQRELQWFKSVRDLFPSYLEYQLNKSGETPEEVFTKEHKDLVEKGEKWMRDTATSCSVVAALITTIVFAAAFTVPGGIDSNGIPNYLKVTYFRIFAFSTAIALFSSTTSVQMFLGMLTSRYEEEDFLELLPRKLIIGLMTLFLSSSSMMVSFGAAFCIVLYHPWKWIIVLICLLGCVPITLYAWMQFPLLVDIFRSTYGPNILNPRKR
ncbi:hypothetical protein LWI29_030877 [Acer saccharum]|uniref:PGG domain-containing protein n=1 Tax=Acer saccharum TaxID=4024 RepID=A0AA39SZV1_ACESA|nr:hypothetical protein LWI29_030877 [Acer saccharum]